MSATLRPALAPSVSTDALRALDGWWRAANYLSVGQIYLRANPLLPYCLCKLSPAQQEALENDLGLAARDSRVRAAT